MAPHHLLLALLSYEPEPRSLGLRSILEEFKLDANALAEAIQVLRPIQVKYPEPREPFELLNRCVR